MSLADFCNASYALLAEQHQRIDPLKPLLEVARTIEPSSEKPVVRTSVATQNDQAASMLSGMMAGVKRKPRV
jgi:hypothetical protein